MMMLMVMQISFFRESYPRFLLVDEVQFVKVSLAPSCLHPSIHLSSHDEDAMLFLSRLADERRVHRTVHIHCSVQFTGPYRRPGQHPSIHPFVYIARHLDLTSCRCCDNLDLIINYLSIYLIINYLSIRSSSLPRTPLQALRPRQIYSATCSGTISFS